MAASTAVAWEDTSGQDVPSERRSQIASLTGLRGFAALMVILIHVAGMTEYKWLGLPDYGPVSLFVLSGYLLYRPWTKWSMSTGRRPSVRIFARRRLARIFPAYLVVLSALVLVFPPARPGDTEGWVRAATLTGIYETDRIPTGLFQTWSLGTELSWYLALPLMAGATALIALRLSFRAGFWFTVGMLALSLPVSALWRWWVAAEDLGKHFTYGFWLPGYLFCFAAGALVAHLVEGHHAGHVPLRRLRGIAADPWTLLVFALAVVLVGTSSLGGPAGWTSTSFTEHQVRVVCATLLAVTLLVGVVLGEQTTPLNRVLSARWSNAIGRWSYGLYLWHLPVIYVLAEVIVLPGGVTGLAAWMAIVLAVSIPLSAATYAWVERPAIRWSRGTGLLGRPAADSAQNRRRKMPPDALRTRGAETQPASATTATMAHANAPTATPTRKVPPGE